VWTGTKAAVIAGAFAAAGCSLLLSTSGFDGEAATPSVDASTDSAAAPDAGNDATSDPSLVGSWTFDEPSGVVSVDKSAHGRDALVLGGAKLSPDGGVRGGAVLFDGNGHVDVQALDGVAFPPSGTLSVWFKALAAPVDGVERAVFDGWDAQRGHIFLRFPNEDGGPDVLQAALQAKGTVPYPWVAAVTVRHEVWTHMVLTWSTADKRAALYVDGKLFDQKAYGAQFQDFVPLEQTFRLGNRFVGAIDEVRLNDRELSPNEAASASISPPSG
jgi:hypothetical protein